jgi:pSer/pThr/pTyr-binding forkhead associated (FHA) protein
MAKLVLSAGGAVLYQCFVDKDRLTVGREAHNQIVIDDPAVSREHAAIVPLGNDHILEDLRSANGTVVNGTKLSRRILQHGDVMEFGRFHLRYLNPKVAADIDLERTMLIEGLSDSKLEQLRDGTAPVAGNVPMPVARNVPMPVAGTARTHFPKGRVWMGAGPRAGEVIELDRVVTMFGRLGVASAVVVRRPLGYYVCHVEGRSMPRVNGRRIGREPRLLQHGDIVEAGGERLEFTLDELDRR